MLTFTSANSGAYANPARSNASRLARCTASEPTSFFSATSSTSAFSGSPSADMTFSFPRPAAYETGQTESNEAASIHARTDVMPKALTLTVFSLR